MERSSRKRESSEAPDDAKRRRQSSEEEEPGQDVTRDITTSCIPNTSAATTRQDQQQTVPISLPWPSLYPASPPSSAGYQPALWPFPPLPPGKLQQQSSADIREQQRRLSHSSIEKRRRERLNDKIQQLKALIPACNPRSDQDPIAAPSFHQPLPKLNILQAAIDYIEQLHLALLEAAAAQDADHSVSEILSEPKVMKVLEHARRISSAQGKQQSP